MLFEETTDMIDLPKNDQFNQSLEDLNLTQKKARSKFTHEEDEKLKQLVENLGNDDWVSISNKMSGRNPRQCRDRWNNYLSPNVVNGPWTKEEEQLLQEKFEEFGPSWKCIATFFPTRTAINVKSRFNLMQRRIKKEELKKKRDNFDKKISQKKPSFFADFLLGRTFFDDTQNLQFCPQKKKVDKKNLSIRRNSIDQQIRNKNLNNSASINTSPLPFISQDKTQNVSNETIVNLSNENPKPNSNDILNLVLLDIENEFDSFYNMW